MENKIPRRGRPPLPESERRSRVLAAAVTPEEERAIRRAAADRGKTVAGYLRDVVLRAAREAFDAFEEAPEPARGGVLPVSRPERDPDRLGWLASDPGPIHAPAFPNPRRPL